MNSYSLGRLGIDRVTHGQASSVHKRVEPTKSFYSRFYFCVDVA